MKPTDTEYLQEVLKSSKLELQEIETKHRIALAEYNVKKEMLQNQIESIEIQLDKSITM